MRLKSLVVKSSITDEIVRDIKFNDSGLSLIVDRTNKKTSGSNIGKTTAVKIIDLCLGAKSVSSLYKEKDTGENSLVKNFLEENKIVAELEVLVDEQKHVFKRSLYKNGKNEIDGEEAKNISTYNEKINKIVFNNFNNKFNVNNNHSKLNTLPYTGENENSLLSLAEFTLLSGLLLLLKRRKKEDK